MTSQKNSKTYLHCVQGSYGYSTAPPPPIINNERESDVADGNDSGDDKDSTPTISPTALLLLRKLASNNDTTINREREMRKSGESNYLFEEQVRLIKAAVEARRDSKVSLVILDEARREGESR
jgi:hypothetical protein